MCAKHFFWNIRGLNGQVKHQPFCNWLFTHKPLFGAILETHIKEPNLSTLMSKLCNGWDYFSNHASDEDGRIIVIWKHPAQLRLIHQSRQSLTCEVRVPSAQSFYFTAVYAANTYQERSDLWMELTEICSNYSLSSSPWMIAGDFNEIIHPMEHSNPDVNTLTTPMSEFKDCLHQIGVFDLRFSGTLHTWTNSCPSSPTAKN